MSDVLAGVLEATNTHGTVFARASLGTPWGLRCDPVELAAFHVVALGGCTITFDNPDAPPIRLGTGDVALLPHGDGHTLFDDPQAPATPLADLLTQIPPGQVGDVHAGGPGAPTVLICGGYYFQHDGPHPLLSQLPTVVHLPSRHAGQEFRAVADLLIREADQPGPAATTVVTRLADILLVHLLRHWTSTQPLDRQAPGWLRALSDPAVAAALTLIHAEPASELSVARLADHAGVSPTTLKKRFRDLTGQAPGAYTARWRMSVAARLLRQTDQPVGQIAARVGYHSQYAFNRAFAKIHNQPPGRYRRATRSRTPAQRLHVNH